MGRRPTDAVHSLLLSLSFSPQTLSEACGVLVDEDTAMKTITPQSTHTSLFFLSPFSRLLTALLSGHSQCVHRALPAWREGKPQFFALNAGHFFQSHESFPQKKLRLCRSATSHSPLFATAASLTRTPQEQHTTQLQRIICCRLSRYTSTRHKKCRTSAVSSRSKRGAGWSSTP